MPVRKLLKGTQWMVLLVLAVGSLSAFGDDAPKKPAARPKKVLVELYTSQGCDSCPPASKLMGELTKLGYGPDRIVPINFHVDYFNDPWVDPFSKPAYSRRELAYNDVLKRDDLYFTPMLMVDGRVPLLGSNRPGVLSALGKASNEPSGVELDLNLDGAATGTRKALTVTLSDPSPALVGRALLVGVAITEGPTSTRVRSGENAGKTLVEHNVVRFFDRQFATLDGAGSKKVTFPLELPLGVPAGKSRVAAFVQDQYQGTVYQADAIPWQTATPATAR